MKIHEYQAKKLFSDYGMPVQDGYIFDKLENADSTIKQFSGSLGTSLNTTTQGFSPYEPTCFIMSAILFSVL